MNSLKVKFIGLTTAILLIIVGLGVWHQLTTERAVFQKLTAQNSRILGETIRNSIISFMEQGENERVGEVFKAIEEESSIHNVQIFDETGRILRSGNNKEIGGLIPASDLHAYRSKNFTSSHDHDGIEYQVRLLPIFNSPNCYFCHDKEQRVLGVLSVHVSMAQLNALQQKGRTVTITTSVVMLLVLIMAITFFILHYVEHPVRNMVNAMTHLERGQFDDAIVTIDSSNEMALLSRKFNRMVDQLRSQIQEMVHQEREIAISREKLSHHEAIEGMNRTLEERLKEIEYLNITLEERIEDIEEANYKIADLAGELESKNTTLEQAVSRLSALYDMGLAINATMELEKLFDLLIRKTVQTLNASTGYILLLDGDNSGLEIGGTIGLPAPLPADTRIPLQEGGISNWVVNNGKPLLVQDINTSGQFHRQSPLGFTRETIICAPIMVKNKPIGTITMANRSNGTSFYQDDLELLSTIAAQAGVAINNAQLYQEQQETYLNTVQALVSAIEASDAYTRGHSERVTRYSLKLATHIGLSQERIKVLEQAAVLHDIGKIGIDLALLHKTGKLSSSDISTLQQHPQIGVKILEPIRFLHNVREIIEHHHERFDGKGYPHGLSGEALCLEARILAVADTYDAMTSNRPYRKALSQDVALQEIRDHAGTQFDPEVASAFLAILDEERLSA